MELSNLKVGDIFEYKGVIYEIIHKNKWSSCCKYKNKHYKKGSWLEYLYCNFSNYTKVNI